MTVHEPDGPLMLEPLLHDTSAASPMDWCAHVILEIQARVNIIILRNYVVVACLTMPLCWIAAVVIKDGFSALLLWRGLW